MKITATQQGWFSISAASRYIGKDRKWIRAQVMAKRLTAYNLPNAKRFVLKRSELDALAVPLGTFDIAGRVA